MFPQEQERNKYDDETNGYITDEIVKHRIILNMLYLPKILGYPEQTV